MKAILLAAGIGDRLKPITNVKPKSLIDILGVPILLRHFEIFKKLGIDSIVIVIGHLGYMIKLVAGDNYKGIPIKYIENDAYKKGSVYSAYLVRDELDEDAIIMDADVVYSPELFKKLMESKHSSCLLMDTSAKETGEEMMLGANNGRVLKIARRLEEQFDESGEGVGFLKVSPEDGIILKQVLEEYFLAGNISCEYETAFNDFFQKANVGYEKTDGLLWTEIDFKEDIVKAEKLMKDVFID